MSMFGQTVFETTSYVSLVERIKTLFKIHGPMTATQLTEEAVKSGWKTRGLPVKNIQVTLSQKKEFFRKLGNKQWGLVEDNDAIAISTDRSLPRERSAPSDLTEINRMYRDLSEAHKKEVLEFVKSKVAHSKRALIQLEIQRLQQQLLALPLK